MLNFILILLACLAGLMAIQILLITPFHRKKACKTIQSVADNLKLELSQSPGLLSKLLSSSLSHYPTIKGKISGFEVQLGFCKATKGAGYSYIAANLQLSLPAPEQLPVSIFSKKSHSSDSAGPTYCEALDSHFIVSSKKGEAYSLALLNETIRKLLFNYLGVDEFSANEELLSISTSNFEASFLTAMVEDMVKLLEHFTNEIDIKEQLTNNMLNDHSEGFSLNCMLTLKDMKALEEPHLKTLCESPCAEIAALAAGELGKPQIPLLLDILQLDESSFCKYMSDEELPFDEMEVSEEIEFYYRTSPPLLAFHYLKQFIDDDRVKEGLYRSFVDEELHLKIDRGQKYTLLLNLFIEQKDSASTTYILNLLEELSEHLVKGSTFKSTLLHYLSELDVKESNEWLQIELDKGNSEEQLQIIKTLGQFGHSSSREQLEQYSKSPLVSKEIKEAAQQALNELY